MTGACAKCGGDDLYVVYHKQGCDKRDCECSKCAYGSHTKRHDEHLHVTCRGCEFDWTRDVVAPQEGPK